MIKTFIKDIFVIEKAERKIISKADKKAAVKYYMPAFFVPLIIILMAAIVRGFAPFGENTLMAIDAWGQYFPMLREMKRAFRSFDFGYSFTGALGFNLTAQSAYYTNSPLWYILFLLPGELTPGQVDMMVFIRFALASLTFSYYISEHYGKKENSMILFSMAYAFSGYTFAFINQFMWMDAVVLLPLVLLGIERLYKAEGGFILYTVSLFLTIYSNFYIAYAVCIFAVLWFFLQTLSDFRGVRQWFLSAFRFGICSVAAGVLNLGVLLPLLTAIGNTLASEKGFGTEFKMYHSVGDMLKMLLPFGKSSLAYGAPNLYFGFFPAVITVFAIFSKESIKKKFGYLLLFVFMFISFNFNLLDFIWHGFHFPNQLPGRQSFLFIFLGLVISYCGFKTVTERFTKKDIARKIVVVILCFFICSEISLNAVTKIMTDSKAVPLSSILRNDEVISEICDEYNPNEAENEFWRIELASHRYNGGQLYGYYGISHYSSTMSGDCYNFFTKLGMSVYAKNVSIEYLPNPVLNALFGVKYIISESPEADISSVLQDSVGHMYVHENSSALPLFYVGDRAVLDVDMTLQGHAFANDIFKKLAGVGDVIKGNGVVVERQGEGYILNSDEFFKGIENIRKNKTELTKISNRKIEGTVNCVNDGVLVISLPAADVEIEIDGEKVETLTLAGYMAGAEISAGEHSIIIKM